jgi:Tol biopolymer transport system component
MVAFISYADNLVEGDTNRLLDVFVHDRQTGQTRRVSVASDGTEADDEVYDPGISADGRFVSFTSRAFTLAENDTNSVCDERGNPTPNCLDVFVHDLETGATTLVSVASDGTIGNAESGMDHVPPALSADGRYVAFWSAASNLVPGCRGDIFIRDRVAGQTTCVSLAWNGAFGNSNSWLPSISADARVIAFDSEATNLVPEPDTNDNTDIFLRIMQTEPSAIGLLRPSVAPSRDPLWLVGILLGAALLLLALRGTRKPPQP